MKKVWKVALSLVIILMIGGGVAYAMGIDKDYFRYLELKNYTEDYTNPSEYNEGFVTYKSVNGEFSFDLPENYFISPELHNSTNYETLMAFYTNPKTKDVHSIDNFIKSKYTKLEKSELSLEIALEGTLYDHSYNNQYEKITLEDKTIFKGENHLKPEEEDMSHDPSVNGPNHFFSLVVDNKTFQSVEIAYSFVCYSEDKGECSKDVAEERKTFEKIIDSISFK